MGATVAVFQWGWLNELVLAMDYEVFLVTRMREAYVHGSPARQAVIDGFAHSARVVAAAMLIIGRRIWWMPRVMNKLVPILDVVGEALAERLAPRRPTVQCPDTEPAPRAGVPADDLVTIRRRTAG
ncbi:MMPL family transporter [Nonomuraea sp. NPDC049714]|uniref:MMPL family transporter n=1 Tax=Nonomuraea sp. NPDC049714 TaxID=3364357 RepID=UPI0037B06269